MTRGAESDALERSAEDDVVLKPAALILPSGEPGQDQALVVESPGRRAWRRDRSRAGYCEAHRASAWRAGVGHQHGRPGQHLYIAYTARCEARKPCSHWAPSCRPRIASMKAGTTTCQSPTTP